MENKSGEMSFFVACQNGHTRTAKDLLKLADPPSLLSPWEGRTCFHVAVIAGDPDLIKIITMKDNKGETALHLAVRKNGVGLVKQLVDLDANLCDSTNQEGETLSLCDCTNQEGETPLKLAVSLGFKEAVELLITHTQNALHYVVKLNQVKIVQFLIEKK